MRANKPYAATIGPWLTANLHRGWSAPLTGQDWPALKAAVETVNAWCSSDGEGRRHAAQAFGHLVNVMQPGCRYLAFHAIAHVGDWGMRWQLWNSAGLAAEHVIGKPGCKHGPENRPAAAAVATAGGES